MKSCIAVYAIELNMGRKPSLSTNDRYQALGMLRAGQSFGKLLLCFRLLKALCPSCCNASTQHSRSMKGDFLVVPGQQQGSKTITSVTLLLEIGKSLQELCNIS